MSTSCIDSSFVSSSSQGGTTPTPPQDNPTPATDNNTVNTLNTNTCTTSVFPAKTLQRLTIDEYVSTVEELTTYRNDSHASGINDFASNVFRNIPEDLVFTESHFDFFVAYSQAAATKYLTSKMATDANCVINSNNLDCVTKQIFEFAKKAFKVELLDSESQSQLSSLLTQLSSDPEFASFPDQVKAVLQYILISAKTLYKVEDKNSNNMLSNNELANRISFSLNGKPASQNEEQVAQAISSQNEDLITDSIESSISSSDLKYFASKFIGQWLGGDNISKEEFNSSVTNLSIRSKMRQEVTAFTSHIFKENKSIKELISANYTFADSELAEYYGLNSNGLSPNTFQAVNTSGSDWGGLATAGAQMLNLKGADVDTEPLRRSFWVFERLLCSEFSPPPPGATDSNDISASDGSGLSKRQRIERDRTNAPQCMSCHQAIDPIGFAFENFNMQGKHRDTIEDLPIDSSGVFETRIKNPSTGKVEFGEKNFANVNELKSLIAESPRFPKCFIRHFAEYVLGREIHENEMCLVEEIYTESQKDDFKAQSILKNIFKSNLFRSIKRGE